MPPFKSLVGKWLQVYQDEVRLFLWSASLLFLIRCSNILFNNFAETAFLKRFGVEYLPVVTAVNSVATFFIMGLLTGFMIRMSSSRLLSYTLMVCGVSVAALRFVVPLDISYLYPVLYVLKTQYEVLFGFLFWNLANDLFNTRQSKRIFPLLTAGGIIGGILGSFGTPFLVKVISLNNLMFAYLITTMIAATVVGKMDTLFPTDLLKDKRTRPQKTSRSITEEIKQAIPLLKSSKLAQFLIILTFMPNVVIPIMNFQFSFAVNETFKTETHMIDFFSYFRGAQNIIALLISLYAGRLYGKFGLPVALMFHPINYAIAFAAFLFRFDIFSAMYARLTTAVLRNTINAPARAVLLGLFPLSSRALIRPFLRGTVVRVAVLVGSGIVFFSKDFITPQNLSLVAAPFVLVWVGSTFLFKKNYAGILIDLVRNETLDLKSLEEQDAANIFKDKELQSHLTEALLASRGEVHVWYARLLQSLRTPNLDELILSRFKEQDDRTQVELLPLLSEKAGPEAMKTFLALADPQKPQLMAAFARTAHRIYPDPPSQMEKDIFERSVNPEVKAYLLIGLYRHAPREYEHYMDEWLGSDKLPERRAGVIAAGESNNPKFAAPLSDMLQREQDPSILPLLIRALGRLKHDGLNALVRRFFTHEDEQVRLAALEVFDPADDEDIRLVLQRLKDPSEAVCNLAIQTLAHADHQNAEVLLGALAAPSRKIRDGVFEVFGSLDIKESEALAHVRSAMKKAYLDLIEADAVRALSTDPAFELLALHLEQWSARRRSNILRALTVYDRSGTMRTIQKGLLASNSRQQANSLEALDTVLDHSLSKVLVPFFENTPNDRRIDLGREQFALPDLRHDTGQLFSILADDNDWVTKILFMNILVKLNMVERYSPQLERLKMSRQPMVRKFAEWARKQEEENMKPEEDTGKLETTIPDRVLALKDIELFSGLTVAELSAISSVTRETRYGSGDVIITEGEQGDQMFFLVSGEVAVLKALNEDGEDRFVELDRIVTGGYFGEMALFEDVVRSATVQATQPSRLLILDKHEFEEVVREYPEIALSICRELGKRIRRLHEKIKEYESKKSIK